MNKSVGLTVTAALTDYMSLTTFRGSKFKTIELIDGELKEYPEKINKEVRNGTSVTLIPSEKYLGQIDLTNDIIENFYRNMSYIIDKDINITLVMQKDPSKGSKSKLFTREFKSQGLASCCKYMSSSLEFAPIEVKYISNTFDLSLAFSFDKTTDEIVSSSYCNFVISTEGGTHEVAATRAICEYYSREAKKQDPNSKYEVSFDDCKKGLVFAVNLEHTEPKFEGQHKSKVSNPEVATDGKRGLVSNLIKVMDSNPAVTKKVIAYLRQISKIRLEANKIKGISVKKNTTFLEDNDIKKFFTVSNRNSTGYREIN